MKKIVICLLLAILLVLAGCNHSFNASEVKSFTFSIGGGLSFKYDNYEINSKDLIMRNTITGEMAGSETPKPDVQWDQHKWDSFMNDLMSCRVQNWKDRYIREGFYDGFEWNVKLKTESETIDIWGNEAYPEQWKDFVTVIHNYINPDITIPTEPTTI